MKYSYGFSTETKTIEIDEKWANVLAELDREDYNNWHKETRRSESLNDEGEWAAVIDEGIEAIFNGDTDEELLHEAINKLKPTQKALIIAIYFKGISQKEYAAKLGISPQALNDRLIVAKKNLKKFF